MNKDLYIDYNLLISAIQQNIDFKLEKISSLEDEIGSLEDQIKKLNKLKESGPESSQNHKAERKFKWSELTLKAFEENQSLMPRETVIEFILSKHPEIEVENNPSVYNHRITTALKNHVKKKTIIEIQNLYKDAVLYSLPEWVQNNALKKKQFDRFIIDNYVLSEYGFDEERYVDNEGNLRSYVRPF